MKFFRFPQRSGIGVSRARACAPVALIGLLVLTSCSAGDGEADAAPDAVESEFAIEGVGEISAEEDLVAMVPDEYEGHLDAASSIPHPPFIDFKEVGNEDEFVGVDYDLLTAIGAKLDLTVTFHVQPFDGLIPGLEAGKYDVITGIADLKERQQTATFLDVSKTGAAIVVKPDNDSIGNLDDLCGIKVGAGKATTLQQILVEYSDESCGDSPIEVIEYPDETATSEGLISGATEAMLLPKVNALMLEEKRGNDIKVIEDPEAPNGYEANPNGFAVLNEHSELADAMRAALEALLDDGTYDAIYEKWGLETVGVDEAVINGAVK